MVVMEIGNTSAKNLFSRMFIGKNLKVKKKVGKENYYRIDLN